jgi:hypothetical protein
VVEAFLKIIWNWAPIMYTKLISVSIKTLFKTLMHWSTDHADVDHFWYPAVSLDGTEWHGTIFGVLCSCIDCTEDSISGVNTVSLYKLHEGTPVSLAHQQHCLCLYINDKRSLRCWMNNKAICICVETRVKIGPMSTEGFLLLFFFPPKDTRFNSQTQWVSTGFYEI